MDLTLLSRREKMDLSNDTSSYCRVEYLCRQQKILPVIQTVDLCTRARGARGQEGRFRARTGTCRPTYVLVGTFIYCVRAFVPTYVRAYVRTHTFCFERGRQPRLSAICLFRHSGIAASLQGIIPVLLYHVCLEFLARHSTLRFALLSFDLRALCIVPRLPCTGTT